MRSLPVAVPLPDRPGTRPRRHPAQFTHFTLGLAVFVLGLSLLLLIQLRDPALASEHAQRLDAQAQVPPLQTALSVAQHELLWGTATPVRSRCFYPGYYCP